MYVFHYITPGYPPRLNIATRFLIKLKELLNCNNDKMNQVENPPYEYFMNRIVAIAKNIAFAFAI